jgi:hypothetical protein
MTNGWRGERIGTEESPGSETSNERHGTANAEECSWSPIDSNHDGRSARVTLICSLLCSVVMAGVFDVREAPATSRQTPIEALHVPELEAGFQLLYELKPEEAASTLRPGRRPTPKTLFAVPRRRRAICSRSATVRAC